MINYDLYLYYINEVNNNKIVDNLIQIIDLKSMIVFFKLN